MATRLNTLIERLQQKTQVFGTFIPPCSIEHAMATYTSAIHAPTSDVDVLSTVPLRRAYTAIGEISLRVKKIHHWPLRR